MRGLRVIVAGGLVMLGLLAEARAQAPVSTVLPASRAKPTTASPVLYGTSWGTASYGLIRTQSAYASPFGVGYGYGYPASGFVPNQYGLGLWRPGQTGPVGSYGSMNAYNTFPYPYKPGGPRYGPSIGVYAPGFGPGNGAALGSH